MSLVKVWNDNDYPFTQKFKGEEIHIPAKGYVEMEYEEAKQFEGYPHPITLDGMGQQSPLSYKMIRIDGKPNLGAHSQVVAYRCHLDGKLFPTKKALDEHIASLDSSVFAEPEEAQAAISKTGKKRTTTNVEA